MSQDFVEVKISQIEIAIMLISVLVNYGTYENFITQIEQAFLGRNKLVGLECLKMMTPTNFQKMDDFFTRLPFMTVGIQLIDFLRQPEILVLTFLFLFFENTQYQSCFHRLLVKKIIQVPHLLCFVSDPDELFAFFISRVYRIGTITAGFSNQLT